MASHRRRRCSCSVIAKGQVWKTLAKDLALWDVLSTVARRAANPERVGLQVGRLLRFSTEPWNLPYATAKEKIEEALERLARFGCRHG